MKTRTILTDRLLIGLVLCFPLVMIPLSLVDYEWTLFLHANRNEFLGDFMDRTLFDGGKFGASDPAILFVLFIFFAYFRYDPSKKIRQIGFYRPQLGFVVVSALIAGLGLVHSIKWVIGRARPDLVLVHNYPYTQWYEFGSQFVADGVFYGSFPSGHTAAVFMLITLSYIFIFDPFRTLKYKVMGWVWGGVTLIYTAAMIIGRSMTLDHWLSDSIGIMFLCWIATHLIFFHLLKIPEQMRYVAAHNSYPPLPRYWELKILWRLLILVLCIMCIIIGIRAVWLQRIPYFIITSIPAIIIIFFLTRNLKAVYTNSLDRFQHVMPSP